MDDRAKQVRRWLADRLGVRVGPHTADYAARQVAQQAGGFYVIGGDARTGRPVRMMVPPELLADAPDVAPSARP